MREIGLALTRRTGHSALVTRVIRGAVAVGGLLCVCSIVAACAKNLDCSSVGYSDVVNVTLPVSMTDGKTTLRMCVDDQCNDEGELKGVPGVHLDGATLSLFLPFNPSAQGPSKSAVQLIATGAIRVEASVTVKWKVDHHGGCAASRYIDLRYDDDTNQLVPV